MDVTELQSSLIDLAVCRTKDSLLNAINDIAENIQPETLYVVPDRIKNIYNNICKAYTELYSVLDSTDRSKYEEELNKIEDDIKNTAMDLNKYIFINDTTGEKMLKKYVYMSIEKNDTGIPLNNRGMASATEHFLTHLDNELEDNYTKAAIVSVLPLRMTRNRYNDYLRNGLKLLADSLSKGLALACLKRFKEMFYARINDSFRTDFPLMCQKLDIMEEALLEDMDMETAEEYLGDLDENTDIIHSLYEILGVYYNDINYLRTQALFAADRDYLFDGDIMLKDLYFALCNSINSGDDSLNEEIMLRAQNEIEERYEITKKLEEKISRELKIINNDKTPPEIELSSRVNSSIEAMYRRELNDALMEIDSDEDIDRLIEELVGYIDETAANIPMPLQKFIKQRFLKNIPCPLSHKEIAEYVSYALDGINDRTTSLMAYNELFSVTDKNNRESEDHEHHHDHEHTHCDCEHEHHHEHTHCNCEHEHHHDHTHCNCEHEH